MRLYQTARYLTELLCSGRSDRKYLRTTKTPRGGSVRRQRERWQGSWSNLSGESSRRHRPRKTCAKSSNVSSIIPGFHNGSAFESSSVTRQETRLRPSETTWAFYTRTRGPS